MCGTSCFALHDLHDQLPGGTIYGESLANAWAVYLVERYAVRENLFDMKGARVYRILTRMIKTEILAKSVRRKISCGFPMA
jgi:hypothetical protein